MRKIQHTYTKHKAKRIACIGDSLTNNYLWGVGAHEHYPRVLQGLLNDAGASVLARNFGVSGEATGQMIARKARLLDHEVPDLAIIYAGTNDLSTNGTTLVTNATTPSTTQFSVTASSGARFPVGSHITINAQTVRITDRSTDLLTVSPALSGAPTSGDTVNCATRENLGVLGAYLQAAGCSRIIIVGRHYDNFTSGGDTTSAQQATNSTLRAKQQGAATDLGAVYCDLYAYMAALITGGSETQASYSWHVFNSNIHLNAHGEAVIADALLATIQAQSGWVSALS